MKTTTIKTKTEGYIIGHELVDDKYKVVFKDKYFKEHIIYLENDFIYQEQFGCKSLVGHCITYVSTQVLDEHNVVIKKMIDISTNNQDVFLLRRANNILSKFKREEKELDNLTE